MSSWDDDDWVGEPPEGRYSRARANPDYWRRLRIPAYAGAVWWRPSSSSSSCC